MSVVDGPIALYVGKYGSYFSMSSYELQMMEENRALRRQFADMQKRLEEQTSETEAWKAQAAAYKDDFDTERSDRERAHGQIVELQQRQMDPLPVVAQVPITPRPLPAHRPTLIMYQGRSNQGWDECDDADLYAAARRNVEDISPSYSQTRSSPRDGVNYHFSLEWPNHSSIRRVQETYKPSKNLDPAGSTVAGYFGPENISLVDGEAGKQLNSITSHAAGDFLHCPRCHRRFAICDHLNWSKHMQDCTI